MVTQCHTLMKKKAEVTKTQTGSPFHFDVYFSRKKTLVTDGTCAETLLVSALFVFFFIPTVSLQQID